ncbi:MAG: nitrophenyl compound nitroreductase subunit ArsF family protein [Candidatus Binatia bacterium]
MVALTMLATSTFGVGVLHTRALAEAGKQPVEPAASAPATPADQAHRVIAYYFHTSYRCSSCRTIEAYSREAVETAFARELEDGRLVWKMVDFEAKGNEHFVEDYALFTKSLVLVNEVPGKPAEWKNLEKVWQLLHDKPAFLLYVQEETRAYLAERP